MKQRTNTRAAAIVIAALTTAGFATAHAQSTQAPRQGGTYQYGDRTTGAPGGQLPDDRRQSGYPQPGTAADTSAPPPVPGTIQDSTAQPTQTGATPGK